MQTETISQQLRWHVVYTKNGEEDRADSNLQVGHIETFAPKMRARRIDKFTGKPISTVKPLFPRYIFARFNTSEDLHKVWYTRGVHSVVSFGEQPSPVDDEVIEFIKSRQGEDHLVKIGDDLQAGDKVVINEGPLKDLAGVFEGAAKERDRVSILLSTVNYQGRVVIERAAVKKAD
ncbi:MAG TPA: transcription termination/antitermination NusG family protein [Pyrinomonadaceae bacterium]|nr:transcription termination/antitermination NusG family protein [Pyrinomonadaceae bacterium]